MIRGNQKSAPRTVDVIIIGAGHAGLAASYVLQQSGVDHLILERGEVANSWKYDRWDSLKLLTPNWMCQLPGKKFSGKDPDDFMSKAALASILSNYANEIEAPVHVSTTVLDVVQIKDGYQISTSNGDWWCKSLVLANGAFANASIPEFSTKINSKIHQTSAKDYRNADQLPDGGVLIVGASATGLQFANEIHRSGRPVTLAVGEHVRMPRSYRGKDVFWWMHGAGLLDETYQEMDDLNRARHIPSPQLMGNKDVDLDLNMLTKSGVDLVGRLVGGDEYKLQFSGSLSNNCMLADLKMNRLLKRFDEWMPPSETRSFGSNHPIATETPATPQLSIDMKARNIKTIVWATGFKPDFTWLNVPVFDRKRKIIHDGGVVASPGMYLLGHTLMRKRKSSYIAGIQDDAEFICNHICGYLQHSTTDGNSYLQSSQN
jgi:putative flavoprotein involved in K+ transport